MTNIIWGLEPNTALIAFSFGTLIIFGIIWYFAKKEEKYDQNLNIQKQQAETDIYAQKTQIDMTKTEQEFRHSIGQTFGKENQPLDNTIKKINNIEEKT